MTNIGLLRHELDGARCSEPTCDHKGHDGALFLHSACHPNAATEARFFASGALEIYCKKCEAFIVRIAIGHEDTERLAPKIACPHAECTEPAENHNLNISHKHGASRDAVVCVYTDGRLTIGCTHCKGILYTLAVRERTASA